MKKSALTVLFVLAATPAAFAADIVTIQRHMGFNEDAEVPKAVLEECKLDGEMPRAVAESALNAGTTVNFAEKVDGTEPGRVLWMEIADVMSDGNGFIGHRKSITVKGKLYEDGKVVGSFKDRRSSMGGAFGGFKGSCSVLVRTANAIGEDIAHWLAAPKMDDKLGDLE